MYFSAKELLTRSASQILFFTNKPHLKPKPTINQIKGISHQDIIAKKLGNVVGQEMGGQCGLGGGTICFANDIVCSDKIIEVKEINGEYSDWFLNNSLLQCAAYKALTTAIGGNLTTARFYVSLGNQAIKYKVNDDIPYYLMFGDKVFRINDVNTNAFINFFANKISAINNGYTATKTFDAKYKHKEFEIMSEYFLYERII